MPRSGTYGTSAQVCFLATAGVTYQIAVDDPNGVVGNVTLGYSRTESRGQHDFAGELCGVLCAYQRYAHRRRV